MKSQNINIRVLFIIAFCLYITNTNAQSNVVIDPEIEHQTIEGWGVSLAWWANLVGGMGDDVVEELAGYAVNDLNLNVFRFNIAGGENPNCTEGNHFRKDGALIPNYRSPQADNEGWGTFDLTKDVRQIKVMNKIAELRADKGDIITEMISYSPPWWMTYGECSAGNVNATSQNLKTEFIDDFADYLASATKGLKTTYPSWNISYIVPFNEPTSGYWKKGGNQEGSAIYPQTQAQILWRLWQRKNALGIPEIKLSGSDNSKVTWSLSNIAALKNNNPTEYNGIAKITTHSYAGDWMDKRDLATFAKENGNKPIWQTETGPLSWQRNGRGWFARHYDMAYRLVEDLRNLKATVWCDWQLMSRDDGWGMIHQTNWDENNPYKTPTFNKTRGFYCRKNFTNFIKVGYSIINTNNGSTLAALSPDKNEAVFVIVNNSGNARSYNVDLNNFSSINSFKTFRTSGSTSSTGENTEEKTVNSIAQKGVLSNKNISYNAPAYSVTTFVIDVSNSLSVENFKGDEVLVYPTPFTTQCTFKLPRNLSNAELIIYNVIGKEVKKISNINSNEIIVERENLDSGMHFYKLIENNSVISKGFLITE
ncbi:glycoside hydrolase [Polaribacter aestuariivivens]|uniref:glycoside hydrolase n=1 Tax=Polaribacter aestuariivivens TaxID=2304626 RepID=UPI003F491225